MARLDTEATAQGRDVSFEFMGASHPERTRGILQLGHFEEALQEKQGGLSFSRYFGFLTAAPEGGKKAVPANCHTCCAVDGSLDRQRFQFRKTYDATLPPNACFGELPRLRTLMQGALNDLCQASCRTGDSQPSASRTFLKTLIDAVESPSARIETQYHYGDRLLSFTSQRSSPAAGLRSIAADVQGRGRHRFSFTFRENGRLALPEKVEYWPRPWLRLTLEPMDTASPKETT